MASKATTKHLAYFRELLGPSCVLTEEEDLKIWGKDWTTLFEPQASVVLLPTSTGQVSAIMSYCHKEHLPVVASGGRTGLAGGAVATQGEVVVSLARMNRILAVDPVGLSIEAEAGVTTQALQEEAKKQDLFFPLDLAAKGSCQIGGNIATNAGGLKLIRFGGTREQVLGLEVVLADGKVLNLNTKLRKNNTGYDLKQCFIGSEGTLGIITKATLRLVPKPAHLQLACLAMPTVEAILELFKLCHQSRLTISAFEFFAVEAYQKVKLCFPQIKPPFAEEHPFYVLLELEGDEAQLQNQLEALLETSFEQGLIHDAIAAHSSAQFNEIWSLRENITESLAAFGHVRKNDVSVPIAAIASFISELRNLVKASETEGIDIILFGHIGDGNLHVNYVSSKDHPKEPFQIKAAQIEKEIFKLVQKYQGSISAEHGIGLLKIEDLGYSRTPDEIQLMKGIKKLFDPTNILNPGKIFKV